MTQQRKPAVGDPVVFYPARTDMSADAPNPAKGTITKVWGDSCVNLELASGLNFSSVFYCAPSGDVAPAKPSGYYCEHDASMDQPKAAPTEAELAAKAVAPRVTQQDVQDAIASEHYFTARDGCEGVSGGGGSYPAPLGLLTFCVLVLGNGFTVTGESACASPDNFNADIGKRLARENAVRKVWPLLGLELRNRLTMAKG